MGCVVGFIMQINDRVIVELHCIKNAIGDFGLRNHVRRNSPCVHAIENLWGLKKKQPSGIKDFVKLKVETRSKKPWAKVVRKELPASDPNLKPKWYVHDTLNIYNPYSFHYVCFNIEYCQSRRGIHKGAQWPYDHPTTTVRYFANNENNTGHLDGVRWSYDGRIGCWCYEMETFSTSLALCERQISRWIPLTSLHRSRVDSSHKEQWRGTLMFFYLHLNKKSRKQSKRRWLETPYRSLWRRCNGFLSRPISYGKCTTPWMFPPLDILLEYWIEPVTFGPLDLMFTFPTKIFYRGVPGFAIDCPCSVWCRGLTTCLLYVGPLFGNLV